MYPKVTGLDEFTRTCCGFSVFSHVLAAYACFLWETEEDDTEDDIEDEVRFQQVPQLHQGVITTANA